jgi:hypothetical protein
MSISVKLAPATAAPLWSKALTAMVPWPVICPHAWGLHNPTKMSAGTRALLRKECAELLVIFPPVFILLPEICLLLPDQLVRMFAERRPSETSE